jgi:L-malate glycosyltransferase
VKVLVIPSWYPGPANETAGVFVQQQVRAVADVADVAVLHVDAGRLAAQPIATVEDGITVVRSSIAATSLRARYSGYRRAGLKAFGVVEERWGTPDIVHVQALWPAALIAWPIRRRNGTPYVVTEHSEEYLPESKRRLTRTPGFVPLFLRPLAHGASRTIAVSRHLADRLAQLRLAVDPVVIPNVVPLCGSEPLPAEPPHLISHVSVMGPAKNLEGLLRAVDRLRTRRSDFRLRLVGDGESRAGAESLATELGFRDIVEFAGRKTPAEVRALLAEAAFTVVSSTHETFSVSAAESLMCGRPVVSTRCGGPEEFVTPDVGRLVEVGDVDALADGLDWMLDHLGEFDPNALSDYARSRFAPDVVARQVLDVYREVLDG